MKRVLIPLAAPLLVLTCAAPAVAAKPLGHEDGDYDTGEIVVDRHVRIPRDLTAGLGSELPPSRPPTLEPRGSAVASYTLSGRL